MGFEDPRASMIKIFGHKNTKAFRRELRKNQTIVEGILWGRLRNKHFGIRCRRQYSIGPYIVDFYFPKTRLIIELDGIQHQHQRKEYDQERDAYLKKIGCRVLRFMNSDIHESLEGVLDTIYKHIQAPSQPSPSKGEGAKNDLV